MAPAQASRIERRNRVACLYKSERSKGFPVRAGCLYGEGLQTPAALREGCSSTPTKSVWEGGFGTGLLNGVRRRATGEGESKSSFEGGRIDFRSETIGPGQPGSRF